MGIQIWQWVRLVAYLWFRFWRSSCWELTKDTWKTRISGMFVSMIRISWHVHRGFHRTHTWSIEMTRWHIRDRLQWLRKDNQRITMPQTWWKCQATPLIGVHTWLREVQGRCHWSTRSTESNTWCMRIGMPSGATASYRSLQGSKMPLNWCMWWMKVNWIGMWLRDMRIHSSTCRGWRRSVIWGIRSSTRKASLKGYWIYDDLMKFT